MPATSLGAAQQHDAGSEADLEPVVLDPADPELSGGLATASAIDSRGKLSTAEALGWLVDQSQAELRTCPAMQEFLQGLGCADPAVWSAYRLGTGGASLTALSEDTRAALTPTGIVHPLHHKLPIARATGITIPTYHPAQPEQPVGIARLAPAQHKYNFVSEPVGLCCAADIATQPRIVIADGPVLGLRLALLGVAGVAIAVTPQVLAPLRDWLQGRDIILAAVRRQRLDAMRAALDSLGVSVRTALLQPTFSHTPPAVLELLGIDPAAVRVKRVITPVPTQLLADLHAFARARIGDPEAMHALEALGVSNAALVDAYSVGYLPVDYRQAVREESRRALVGQQLGGCVVLPAYGSQGEVVDLYVLYGRKSGRASASLMPAMAGMLAPAIATSTEQIVVTNSVRVLAEAFRRGQRDTLLLRGPEDARLNGARLRAAGVVTVTLRVRGDSEPFAEPLRAAGVAVRVLVRGRCRPKTSTPRAKMAIAAPAAPASQIPAATPTDIIPTTPSAAEPTEDATLAVVEVDHARRQAVLRSGEVAVVAELPVDCTVLEVLLRRHGNEHRDRFNLAEPAQRQRFGFAAERRLRLPPGSLSALLEVLLPRLAALVDEDAVGPAPAAPSSDTVSQEAETLLASADLVGRFAADLDALGWVGDRQAKTLVLWALVGRRQSDPPWVVLRGDPALTGPAMAVLSELVPDADRVVLSRATEAIFGHGGRDAMRHRVLLCDDAVQLRRDTVTRLSVLQSRGALAVSESARDPATGRIGSRVGEARGPVALIAASTEPTPLDDLAVVVRLDDSSAQTERALEAARRRRQGVPDADGAARLLAIWRWAIASVSQGRVCVPFARRVRFPSSRPRHLREQDRYFALVEASALLHQQHRLRDGVVVVATEEDFRYAEASARGVVARAASDLSDRGAALLACLRAQRAAQVTMPQLRQLLPQWSYAALRAAVAELVELELFSSHSSGRGRRAHPYDVAPEALVEPSETATIALLPVGAEGRDIGGLWRSPETNIPPAKAGA